MEGVNLSRWGSGYARLDPHRGCYLGPILGGNPYDQHYGGDKVESPFLTDLRRPGKLGA